MEKFGVGLQKIINKKLHKVLMIPRTLTRYIEKSLKWKAIVLITGARQVGKTTLCKLISETYHFDYVSLAVGRERELAVRDPKLFLDVHPFPLIIDEIQYAPGLFEVLEEIVDERKFKTGSNNGMYFLAGSQMYNLMQGVTQSLAGRVLIIEMSPLSMAEVLGRSEIPFEVDFTKNIARASEHTFSVSDVYSTIVRGGYPELYDSPDEDISKFYSDYVDAYIERDVSQIINLKDQYKFRQFLQYIASLTGQELVYSHISNALGLSIKTVQAWLGVLVSGGIVRLLQPYVERSNVKSLVRRPKLYFCDTGLCCYLARIYDPETLRVGYLGGPMVETFIINEIMKSYSNNTAEAGFYYYRDSSMNEIDLVMLRNGVLTFVECKAGASYTASDVKAFSRLSGSMYSIGPSCIICFTDRAYPIKDGVFALPISSI